MRYLSIFMITIFGHLLVANAQSDELSQLVSVQYDRMQLKHALNDLQRRYAVQFSYSSDHVPLSHRVNVHREKAPLGEVLDDLFAETHVAYAPIGKQIVLKNDPSKPLRNPWQEPTGSLSTYERPNIEILPIGPRELTPIENPVDEDKVKDQSVVLSSSDETILSRQLSRSFLDSLNTGLPEDKRFYQASVFPPFGTNGFESGRLTNLYSVNLLAGHSGGVEGSEVSLLLNTTEGDVRGLQMSGAGNIAEGDMRGTQLTGGTNLVFGKALGRQVSGAINAAREMNGTQLSLVTNVTTKEFRGQQISGLFNFAGGTGAPGSAQVSGFGNFSANEVAWQIATGWNFAKQVSKSQIGLINTAGQVEGSQWGVINMADTVGGLTFGMLNIVLHGYNHFELSTSESLWANAALKLGSRSFYNVFHSGIRWGKNPDTHIWGLGYGVGTNIGLSRRFDLNLELVSIHLSKGKRIVQGLNLLNQFRFTLDWRIARHFGLFAGGTLNLMTSTVPDPETGNIGYDIAPYFWYHATSPSGTEFQGWMGFLTGVRF